MDDLISRQAAIEHWRLIIDATSTDSGYNMGFVDGLEFCISHLSTMPSAQPEQRYTEEELRVFQHGISLSLLSKRSAQHWQYDKDTATEIEFLERLYDKVVADMRGEQDEQ